MIDRKRLEKLEHAVPRQPCASSRASLREMSEEDLREILRSGRQEGEGRVADALLFLEPAQLRSLQRRKR
jgi:hypothetical protein